MGNIKSSNRSTFKPIKRFKGLKTREKPIRPQTYTPINQQFYDDKFSQLPKSYAMNSNNENAKNTAEWVNAKKWPHQQEQSLDPWDYSQEEWNLAIQHGRSLPWIRTMTRNPWLFVEETDNLKIMSKSLDISSDHKQWYPNLMAKLTHDNRGKKSLELEGLVPFDMLTQEILPHLSPFDLKNFSLCSARCYIIANNEDLWKRKVEALERQSHQLATDLEQESGYFSSIIKQVKIDDPSAPWKFIYISCTPGLQSTVMHETSGVQEIEVVSTPWYCGFHEMCIIYNLNCPTDTKSRWFGKGFIQGDNGHVMDFYGVFYWNNAKMGFIVCDTHKKPSPTEEEATKQHFEKKFPKGTKLKYYIQWTDPCHPYSNGLDL